MKTIFLRECLLMQNFDNTNSLIKELQLNLLEILEEVIRICDKNDIKYILAEGTLLGAVRHKGFIPWDDDLDIIMPREDYEKFKKVVATELDENYFFQDYRSDLEYPSFFAKVRCNKTTFIEKGYRKLKKMNHGTFLDIFVADGYHPCFKNTLRLKFVRFCRSVLLYQKVCDVNKILQKIARIFPRNFLFKLVEKTLKAMNAEKNNDRFFVGNNGFLPIDTFENLKEQPFETLMATIPANYDKVLSNLYGDYMQLPPIEHRIPRHMTKWISLSIPYEKYIMENMK